MAIKNLKIAKRVFEVSLGLVVLTSFTGCTQKQIIPSVVETLPEDPNAVSYKDLEMYDYYIICLDGVKYGESIFIVKRITLADREEYGDQRYEYCYTEINENEVMGTVYIDKNTNKVLSRTGPDILFALKLTDYLDYYDKKQPKDHIIREYYSKTAMDAIYQKARDDFKNNNLNKLEKEKVYLKTKD